MAKILVIAAHPAQEHSRVTRCLLRRLAAELAADHAADSTADRAADWAADWAPAGDSHIEVRDVYALYPDYFIDTRAEQAALASARLVVWLHPIHWYSMPPLLKLWVDEVLAFGWAYGPGGTALRGKDLWLVASTGGPEESYHPAGYNRYFFDAYLPPYEQTARLTGMRWLPPLVLHGAHRVDDAALERHAQLFVQRLRSWPDPTGWPELAELEADERCDVPADARPTRAAG